MMQTFKILVVGACCSGKTSLIRSLSEIDVVSTEKPLPYTTERGTNLRPISLDFGRTTLSDDLILYYFGTIFQSTIITLEMFSQNNMFRLGDIGSIVVVDSHSPNRDDENRRIFNILQGQKSPYVVVLNRRDVPGARTPQEMREILSIPDDTKVLSYDLNRPATTKQVVLELIELFPRDEIVQQVIDGLRAKIEEA